MRKYFITIVLFISIAIVLYVWFTYPDKILARFGGNNGEAGSYGDIFGAVNALFTSLAFALLIYTALMQREELKLQRAELEQTRIELKRSADAQEDSRSELAKQLKTMNKSAVLSGYTTLLNHHREEQKYFANHGKQTKAADHGEKARHAAQRIDDLTRDIETQI